VIEYGEFERVGGSATVQVDVRILGATNADLPALAQQGKFRADLLDRLAFDVVNVPPLRHRREDILPLAEHFAINIIRELGREFFPGFTEECREALLQDSWPGNVRGLKNAVERSVYRSTDPDAQIKKIVFDPFETSFRSVVADSSIDAADSQSAGRAATETHELPAQQGAEEIRQLTALPVNLKAQIAELEKTLIDHAMQAARFRQPQAAELLGLTYNQLRALLRKHELVERYGRTRKQ